MIRLGEILDNIRESVRDRGIFKAVFIVGLPAAGKSTLIDKNNPKNIGAKIITIDKHYEHRINKQKGSFTFPSFSKLEKGMKSSLKLELFNYINGALPLIIDTTGTHYDSLITRKEILEELGYDTSMVFVASEMKTSLKRMKKRPRKVDVHIMKKMHNDLFKNRSSYRNQFKDYIEIDNVKDVDQNGDSTKVSKFLNDFFNSDVKNPIGIENIKNMEKNNGYLTNTSDKYSIEKIKDIVKNWY